MTGANHALGRRRFLTASAGTLGGLAVVSGTSGAASTVETTDNGYFASREAAGTVLHVADATLSVPTESDADEPFEPTARTTFQEAVE